MVSVKIIVFRDKIMFIMVVTVIVFANIMAIVALISVHIAQQFMILLLASVALL